MGWQQQELVELTVHCRRYNPLEGIKHCERRITYMSTRPYITLNQKHALRFEHVYRMQYRCVSVVRHKLVRAFSAVVSEPG